MARLFRSAVLLLMAVSLFSCKKDAADPALVNIEGEWQLVSVNGEDAGSMFGGDGLEVYLGFSADGTFETFQKLDGSDVYVRYSGRYSIHGTTASGTYSDGSPWAADYSVSLTEDRSGMTMSAGSEECVYTRTSIPDVVRDNVSERAGVKSGGEDVLSGRFL